MIIEVELRGGAMDGEIIKINGLSDPRELNFIVVVDDLDFDRKENEVVSGRKTHIIVYRKIANSTIFKFDRYEPIKE